MVERYRILHCLRAPVGGLFRHVRDLAIEQAGRGHAVGVVCDSASHDPLTSARLTDLSPHLALGLHKVAMSRDIGLSDFTAARAVHDLALVSRADILHGHGAKGGAYARFAAHRLVRAGHPVAAFYTPHGGSLHYDPASLVGRAYMAAERHMARMTSGIIFESAYAERIFRTKVGAVACPHRVIHNGIAPSELEPVPAAADAADFLFVGELRRLKGVDLLLAAMARIRKVHPSRLVIVGAGPDEAAFRTEAASLGLEASVTFAGAMPARRAFALGRTLVMPSRAESFPYIALEAAAAGKPLLATRVGGVPEIVAGTETTLVPPDDIEALAGVLAETCVEPQKYIARAAQLRSEIARRFTVSAMTDGVLAFYGDTLRKAAA